MISLSQAVTARWHSRDVSYQTGTWDEILAVLPEFDLTPFALGQNEPANPYLRTVVRKPLTDKEKCIPVGTVSPTYSLAPHRKVAELCRKGVLDAGADIKPDQLCYEVGLSMLGEWMNFRVYLPDAYNFRDKESILASRLECFNSVDGSSRLVIMFGWQRLVCLNGMVIGETKITIKERHGQWLNLASIPSRIKPALAGIESDRSRMKRWQGEGVSIHDIAVWVNDTLSDCWNTKAAARVFHICAAGQDIELEDPFLSGLATEKPVRFLGRVPGSEKPARTKYDVSQALSFVATSRNDAEERVAWQARIPLLLKDLPETLTA